MGLILCSIDATFHFKKFWLNQKMYFVGDKNNIMKGKSDTGEIEKVQHVVQG